MPTPPIPEDEFRQLVQSVQDYGIFMLDAGGHVVTWNAGAARMKRYDAEDIIGRHFSVFYPPEDIAAGKPATELRTALTYGRVEDEGWRLRKDGTRFWAHVVITPLYDDNGGHNGFGSVVRDMTEQRAAERALRESEERFRLMVQSVQDYAIFMLDTGGHVATWNIGAARMKRYDAEDIIGKHFSVFYPPEDIAAGKPATELRTALADGRVEDEGWRLRKDSTRFWANVVITALRDDTGRHTGFGKVTRDMTEQRAAEHELSERRRLLNHLVHAQEVERRRIAWDVHDDSIQSMVAVGMRLQLLAARVPAEHTRLLEQLDETVRAAIGRLRGLVFQLRPTAIDRHGLVPALSAYLDGIVAGWGLKPVLDARLDTEPPPATALTIFRICQEALNNVHKHARASTVAVTLYEVEDGIRVRITDDGVGFRPDLRESLAHEHFGLVEMRERSETAGGWWTVESAPGGGTTVEFWLPVPR